MSTFSGKDGLVQAGGQTLAEITAWSFATRASNPSYASSSTGGYRRRVSGVREGSGTIRFKLDPADPLSARFDSGDPVTLQLFVDAMHYYSVPAVIDSVRIEVDIDRGEVVGGVVEFSTNGPWTAPAYSG